MAYEPLLGRVGYWLRGYRDTSEQTTEKIIDTMRGEGGGDCLCLKVAEGLTWQGEIDPLTPVRSLEDVIALRDACHAAGVTLLPVVVPRGEDPRGEAAMHGEVASAVGALMTDIEPYKMFWDKSPLQSIPTYTAALRSAAPDAYLINQPDPREWAVSDARVQETSSHFNAIAAQHYVGFPDWNDVDREVTRFRSLKALGRDMYVTIWGLGRLDLALAFWDQVRSDCSGVNIFAFGNMNREQLNAIKGMPRPGQTPFVIEKPSRRHRSQSAKALVRDQQTGWLCPVNGPLTAGFGATTEVRDGGTSYLGQRYDHFNKGIDFGCVSGSPIQAVTDGRVVIAGNAGDGWDVSIKILDDFGITHNYGHLDSPLVSVGKRVTRGDTIAKSGTGSSAHSTGAHLSYDVYRDTGGAKEFVDPTLYLASADAVLSGVEAVVEGDAGANIRIAPSMGASVLRTVPKGSRLQVRQPALYPMLWSANGVQIWSGDFVIDPSGFQGNAFPGSGVPKPAATIRAVADPIIGSKRLKATTSGFTVTAVAPTDSVMPLQFPEWYPVQMDDLRGWVHSSLVAFTTSATSTASSTNSADNRGKVNASVASDIVLTINDNDVRFRSTPEFSENVIARANLGTRMALRLNGSIPVDYLGIEAWIPSGELVYRADAAISSPRLAAVAIEGSTPSVYANPDGSGEVIGQIPAGQPIRLRSKAFYPALWNGEEGWIWGEFLSAEAGTPPV